MKHKNQGLLKLVVIKKAFQSCLFFSLIAVKKLGKHAFEICAWMRVCY